MCRPSLIGSVLPPNWVQGQRFGSIASSAAMSEGPHGPSTALVRSFYGPERSKLTPVDLYLCHSSNHLHSIYGFIWTMDLKSNRMFVQYPKVRDDGNSCR